MARERGKRKIDATDTSGFGGSLGDLLQHAGFTASTGSDRPAPQGAAQADDRHHSLTSCGQLRVRRERKGRHGKEVTLVEGLDQLGTSAREDLARRLRKQLGCGASFEGPLLVLQGDQRERLTPLLEAEGARTRID